MRVYLLNRAQLAARLGQQPPALPGALVQLAHAIDAVLELPDLPIGLEMRATFLREAIDVPKRLPEPIEVDVSPRQRIQAPAERAAVSRARDQAKRIPDRTCRELAVRALAAGWQMRRTGSGHFLLEHGRQRLTLPASPSDWRGVRNATAQARRLGLDTSNLPH